MAVKNQGIAGLNIGDTNTLLNQMGKPKSLGDLAKLYKQGILGQGPLKNKFVPPVGRFKTAPGQSTGMGYLKDIANFGLSGVDLFNQGIGAISAVTNPSGNLIGDYLSQEDPDSFEKRKNRVSDNFSGPEVFLPDENRNIYGAFSPEGQKALGAKQSEDFDAKLEENAIAGESDIGPNGQESIQKRLAEMENVESIAEEEKGIAGELTASDIGGTEVEGADTNAKKATVGALNEFLSQVRGDKKGKPKNYDEYIKEFGEATGLDISGEPDNKQALMSFGLALMQNRAGKGFDLSKILTATGEAGEAAMPDFRKAVDKAQAIRAKAGVYALGESKTDKAKAMNRQSYVVIPKKGGLANSIMNNDGKYERLNSYELNNLIDNKEFNEQFEIIDSSVYTDMTKSLITAQGKNKTYLEKPQAVALFNGSDLEIDVFYGNPNTGSGVKPKLASDPKIAISQVERMEQGLAKGEAQFKQLGSLLSKIDITNQAQVESWVKQTARNFGIQSSPTTTGLQQVKDLLKEIGARNAAAILGETGKTLSDNDRKMVNKIIGEIDFSSGDKDQLITKLNRLYSSIVGEKRKDINQAYKTLNSVGIRFDKGSEGTSLGRYEKFTDDEGVIYRRSAKGST